MAKTNFSIKTALNALESKSNLIVTPSDRDTFALNVAHYKVNLSNYIIKERYTNNTDSSIISSDQGYMLPVMGQEFDEILISKIKKANAQFLNTSSYFSEDELRNAVYQVLTNSRVAYAVLVMIYRSQAGMNAVDANKVSLAPVLWHHEFKGITGLDGHIANGGFIEILKAKDFNTLDQRKSSNDVCCIFGIANKEWGTIVSEMLANIYLPDKWKRKLEHFFSKVFLVPGGNEDNINAVVFWPTSQILTGVNAGDLNVEDRFYKYEQAGGSFDNTAGLQNLIDYKNKLVDTTAKLFEKYPQLDNILNDIQCYNGSSFDFTRPIAGQTVNWVFDENIEHFIKTTSISYMYTSETGTDDPVPPRHMEWAYATDPGVLSNDQGYWFKPATVEYNSEAISFQVEKLPPNLKYQRETFITPEDDALFKGWICPLSDAAIVKYQAGNSTAASYKYYIMPIMWIGGYVGEFCDVFAGKGTGDNKYLQDWQGITNAIGNMMTTLAASGAISPAKRINIPDFSQEVYDLDDYVNNGLLAYTDLLETTANAYFLSADQNCDLQAQAASAMFFNRSERKTKKVDKKDKESKDSGIDPQ